jgi:two-component system, NarL family, sensor kinase
VQPSGQSSEVTVPRALTVHQHHAKTSHRGCSSGACEHYEQIVRLRRNLHDELGPGLAGIMLRADILSTLLSANQGPAEKVLRELRDEAATFMTEVRRVLANEIPAELDGHRLEDALAALAQRMSAATGGRLTVHIDVDVDDRDIDPATRTAAFSIAKEALTNVVKHAGASTCELRVWAADGLHVSVVDDGVGGAGLARPRGGLTSMGSRAAELGGWCEVAGGAAPHTGVVVTAHLPARNGAQHAPAPRMAQP